MKFQQVTHKINFNGIETIDTKFSALNLSQYNNNFVKN